MSFPYLDVSGVELRSPLRPSYFDEVEAMTPGFTAQSIATNTSRINSQLRKRYGGQLPWGRQPPSLVPAGPTPPAVVLQGTPTLGSLLVTLQLLTGGPLGTSTFQWSSTGGATWNINPTLAASGSSPPAVTVSGASGLATPSELEVQITTDGTLGTSRFQWSATGGVTWNIAPAMMGSGVTPPPVTLGGTSNLALPSDAQVRITIAGPLGSAMFEYSLDGGSTWVTGLQTSPQGVALGSSGLTAAFGGGTYATSNLYTGQGIATAATYWLGTTGLALAFAAGTYDVSNSYVGQGVATAASVSLAGTGMVAVFPAASYDASNSYAAATPVPETILQWLTAFVSDDVGTRHGINTNDPLWDRVQKRVDRANEQLEKAANSQEGLWDLPVSEDQGSAVDTGGPLGYSESSPYQWSYSQQASARRGRFGWCNQCGGSPCRCRNGLVGG